MRSFTVPAVLTATIALAGCQGISNQDRANLGLLGGAGAGLLTASAFDANPAWTILATVTGAAIGTQVARNTQTGECAYSNGDGTYFLASC